MRKTKTTIKDVGKMYTNANNVKIVCWNADRDNESTYWVTDGYTMIRVNIDTIREWKTIKARGKEARWFDACRFMPEITNGDSLDLCYHGQGMTLNHGGGKWIKKVLSVNVDNLDTTKETNILLENRNAGFVQLLYNDYGIIGANNEYLYNIGHAVPGGAVWRNGGSIKPIYLVRPNTGDIIGVVMPVILEKYKGKVNPILIDLKTIYKADKEGFINDANVKEGGEDND